MDVFVYGTLTERSRVERVLGPATAGSWAFAGRATIDGLHRVEGRYPTLAPGGRVGGQLLSVDRAALDRLDRYEGVEQGLYVRVAVPRAGGSELEPGTDSSGPGPEADATDHVPEADTADAVWTYVGDPDRLGVDHEWPGEGSLTDRVRTYISTSDVAVETIE